MGEHGFGLDPVEVQLDESGNVNVSGTIDHAFSLVKGGDGVVKGVLMKRDTRHIACTREGSEIRWLDVPVTSSKGSFTDVDFLEHLGRHECFRVYRGSPG